VLLNQSSRPRTPAPGPRLLAPAALLLGLLLAGGCGDPAPRHPPLAVVDGEVAIPLASVGDGRVHFYSSRLEGKFIDFFVRSDARGKLSVYLDACYSCCKYGRGYLEEDGRMVCRACRVGFELAAEEWDYVGACAPIRLKSTLHGERLVIKRSQLARGLLFFP